MWQDPAHLLDCERWPQDYVSSYANQLSRAIWGKPSKAREKTTAPPKKCRAVAGKLSLVMEVPVDVFFEIIGHLHPRDVLNLARTSKQLRGLLMSKRSRPAWRVSRARIGLADCPQELSEPEYANLVFCTDCQICGAQNILKADYYLKLRLCRSCTASNVLPGRKLVKEIDSKLVKDSTVYNLVPCQNANGRVKTVGNTHRFCGDESCRYFKPAFTDALERYIIIRREKDEERLRTFTTIKYDSIITSIKHACQMQNWINAEKEAVTAENIARQSQRQKEILDGLYALGYMSNDIPTSSDFERGESLRKRWDQLLNRNQEMNERNWKAVLPKLEDVLRRTKESRQQRTLYNNRSLRETEVSNLYEAYIVANLSDVDRALLPNAWDLFALTPVRELIEEDACTVEITQERWQPVLDLVLQDRFFDTYREKVLEDCRLGLAAACPDAQEDICGGSISASPAYVIVTVAENFNFRHMPGWEEPMTLYDALLTRAKTKFKGHHLVSSPGFVAEISFPKSMWDVEKLRFDSDAIYTARSLLSVCGLPMQTPVSEMLKYGTELKCARCPAEYKRRMTWVEIVCHYEEEASLHSKAMKQIEVIVQPKLDDVAVEEMHCLTFLNTHSLASDSPAIIFPLSGEEDIVTKRYSRYEGGRFKLYLPDEEGRLQCKICSFAAINRCFKLQAELDAHIRDIHAKEPEPRDMKQSLRRVAFCGSAPTLSG